MPKAPAKSSPTKASDAPVPESYEVALQELETLVTQLESGAMPLADLLTGYQRGAQLLAFCRDRLASVENQIKLLDGDTLKAWTPE
jgi:exodeoxyribonuclease VII small subunit